MVCETHPAPSPVQVRAGDQQGLDQISVPRGCGATKANSMVIPRPQTRRLLPVRPSLSQATPPPVTQRGFREPRPALRRPPLGPGLPRLTLPLLARAGSASEPALHRLLESAASGRGKPAPGPAQSALVFLQTRNRVARAALPSARPPEVPPTGNISQSACVAGEVCLTRRGGAAPDWSVSGNRWSCPPQLGFWFFKTNRRAGGKEREV